MSCTLAKPYTGQPVEGWLMSEKLDGVRALWDGHQITSRNGNIFVAPDWFLAALPPCPLDGELWLGRGRFQAAAGIVRRKAPNDADWLALQYRVFDAPAHPGEFAARLEEVRRVLVGNQVASALEHIRCNNDGQMWQYFEDITQGGGEGVMLRNPAMRYEQGRTANLLKLKPTDSTEARVIGHQAGKGRHEGRLGALECELNGLRFNVGTGLSDADRDCPPPVGSLATVEFCGLTDGGIPRFPVFVAVRDYE